ncbi:MAG: late competence development ComFB family protein [Nodosilinea sp.]
MKVIHEIPRRAYINVMEILVAEEVEAQMQTLPPRVLRYLKAMEVETYALNRLPALYASSEKGWEYQYEKAKRELRNQIKTAVRQAVAAVQVDPLRSCEPLQLNQEDPAQGVLNSLRELLRQPDLSWDGLINRIKTMVSFPTGETQFPSRADQSLTNASPLPSDSTQSISLGDSTASMAGQSGHSRHWRPGTYGSDVAWQKKHVPPSTTKSAASEFNWDDPRYIK